MAFSRPTLSTIIARVYADISSRVEGVGAIMRRSVLGVIGRVLAGAAHELYGFLQWIFRQAIPDTATDVYLERWANVWGVQRLPAAFADGQVNFTGTTGAIVPVGTLLQRADGARFRVTAEIELTGAPTPASVVAEVAGGAGNTIAGVILALVQPVAGVQGSAAVATGGLVGGADQESDAALQARMLSRIREPPQGGAAWDYTKWALEVPGVTRAWVYPMEMGPGTVTVRFVRDGDADIIPDAGEVADVFAYIEPRRPVTAELFVVAPVAVPLDFDIQVSPNTSAVRESITAELRDLIRREAVPGGGLLLTHIAEAISTAAGEFDHVLIAPAANVTTTTGQMLTLGDVDFANIP